MKKSKTGPTKRQGTRPGAAERDGAGRKAAKPAPGGTSPGIAAAEALSFLKETKGVLSWTTRELAAALNLGVKEAEQVLTLLEMQGYVKPVGTAKSEWMTTPAGEVVSGSKTPRFERANVESALGALRERLLALNKHRQAEFRVGEAVAFGDFLGEFAAKPARVQAADVGIELRRRAPEGRDPNSVPKQAAQRGVLRQLRGGSLLLNLRAYEAWMSHRRHRRVI
jgi:hypothetical protein